MDFLKELARRTGLDGWESWSIQYRALAVIVGLVLVVWMVRTVLRLALPSVFRLGKLVLLAGILLVAIWVAAPDVVCSTPGLSTLPLVCAR
jgi:multisubunit Na+/H+ antiporter MnhE subunit